jgi:hypothetical protein
LVAACNRRCLSSSIAVGEGTFLKFLVLSTLTKYLRCLWLFWSFYSLVSGHHDLR